jgi:hypothetical protein
MSADLRLSPEATLNWLCRHLDLSQHLQSGQELEVPAEQLSQYDLQGAPPAPEQPLAKLHGPPPSGCSIHQHQHGGFLGRLYHVLKFAVLGAWFLELGCHCRH